MRDKAVVPVPGWTPLNPSDKQTKDVRKLSAETPGKCSAQREKIAPVHVFLASPPCSGFITGEMLPTIGG
jgi:NAD(P)-dependent dehydrogenase (short-subunit alcohol dehydrogenase family)